MSEYADNFERASKLIQAFILSQEVVYKNPDELFGEDSWMSNFFGLCMNQFVHPEVVNQLNHLLDIGDTEQRPYNTALARVYALYTKLSMSCGRAFMLELEENCIHSLMNMIDSDRNPRKNVYKSFSRLFHKYPVLVISALGNDFFSVERMNYIHNKRVTPQSHPAGSVK